MAKLSNSETKKPAKKETKKAPPRPDAPKVKEEAQSGEVKTKLPRFRRYGVQLKNLQGRIETKGKAIAGWRPGPADLPAAADKLAEAAKLIGEAAEELDKLPDGYRPSARGSSPSKAKLEEGAKVQIREDKRGRYEGMVPLDEEFTVVGFRKRNVKVETSEGIVFIPRGDLSVAKAEKAA